jgi:hypothetical protein
VFNDYWKDLRFQMRLGISCKKKKKKKNGIYESARFYNLHYKDKMDLFGEVG